MGSTLEDAALREEGFLQDERGEEYTGDGTDDFRGRAALKKNTGNWRACPFILGNECCERLAYFGISTNLVTYVTTKLHQGNVSAARDVSIWLGTSYLTPLLGAVIADGYWGRYWTIAASSLIYFIGLCTLTLSASLPALKPAECLGSVCPSATPAQYAVFYFGLLIVWIQDNRGWGLGFGIPALFMGLSIVSFFMGTRLYRFQKPRGSPLTRICQVLHASVRKCNLPVPGDSNLLYEIPAETHAIRGSRKLVHREYLRGCQMRQCLKFFGLWEYADQDKLVPPLRANPTIAQMKQREEEINDGNESIKEYTSKLSHLVNQMRLYGEVVEDNKQLRLGLGTAPDYWHSVSLWKYWHLDVVSTEMCFLQLIYHHQEKVGRHASNAVITKIIIRRWLLNFEIFHPLIHSAKRG
ncbi:hypothetical protein ACSQ67_003977 [Phaseolus vulgaris]